MADKSDDPNTPSENPDTQNPDDLSEADLSEAELAARAEAGQDKRSQPASVGFLAGLMAQFTTAWCFFTRIPLPRWWNKPEPVVEAQDAGEAAGEAPDNAKEKETSQTDKGATLRPLNETVRTWPFVGLLVGALAGLFLWTGASLGLHPLAASFLGLAVAALATGALHEDGLADVADGFGGGADRAKKLRIMRDSRIGTYGMLAVVFAVAFKGASLNGFTGPAIAAAALIAAHTLSRAFLPLVMVFLSPVRRTGLGKAAGQPKREDAVMAAAIGVLIAVLALGPLPGLAASVLAGLGVGAVALLAQRQLGGFTGDVLGAAQQAAEALVLAGMAAMLQTVFYL